MESFLTTFSTDELVSWLKRQLPSFESTDRSNNFPFDGVQFAALNEEVFRYILGPCGTVDELSQVFACVHLSPPPSSATTSTMASLNSASLLEEVSVEALEKFRDSFQHVQSVTLEKQQKEFGEVLRQRFYPQLVGDGMDSYFLPPIGTVAEQLHSKLDEVGREDTQTRKVIGIAEASGAGKTKLYFSLGMKTDSKYSVIFIRLYDRADTKPFEILKTYLEDLKQEELKKETIEKEEEKRKRAIATARQGYDYVRLYVLAHVIWIAAISAHLKLEKGVEQRIAWLYALRNGDGNVATADIFRKLLQRYTTFIGNKHQFVDTEVMTYIKNLTKDYGPVLFAFDEIASSQGCVPGLFFHWDGYTTKAGFQARESELRNNPNRSTVQQAADLFYIFRVLMRRLLSDFPLIFVAMSDTCFSMYDVVEQNIKSPLNGLVLPWSQFQSFDENDYYQFFRTYFFTDDRHEENLKARLVQFRGRPHFFFVTLKARLFTLLSKHKPQNQEILWSHLEAGFFKKTFNKCVSSFSKEVIEKHWDHNQSCSLVSSHTVSSTMKQLHASLYLGGGKVKIRSSNRLKELITTGLLFSSKLSNQAVEFKDAILVDLHQEPVVKTALQSYGDLQLEQKSDHITHYLSELLTDANQHCGLLTAIKGQLGELLATWFLIKRVRSLKKTNEQVLLSDVLEPLLPKGFSWPTHFQHATISVSNGFPL